MLGWLLVMTGWVGRDFKTSLGSNPPATGRAPFHQPRVLPAPSNLALNTARDGAATASLGSLGWGLATLTGKNCCILHFHFSHGHDFLLHLPCPRKLTRTNTTINILRAGYHQLAKMKLWDTLCAAGTLQHKIEWIMCVHWN